MLRGGWKVRITTTKFDPLPPRPTICRPGLRLTSKNMAFMNHERRDSMRGSVLTFMNDERKSYFDLPFEAFINYYCKPVRSYHEQKILLWWIPLLRLQNQGAGWCFNYLLFRSSRMKLPMPTDPGSSIIMIL